MISFIISTKAYRIKILYSSRQYSTFITHNFPLTMTRASIVTNFSGLFTLKVILFPLYCPGPHVIKYLAQAYSTFIIIPSFNAFCTKCRHSFTMYPMPLIILHIFKNTIAMESNWLKELEPAFLFVWATLSLFVPMYLKMIVAPPVLCHRTTALLQLLGLISLLEHEEL